MANVAGWMVFVDGENFTIRAQELAKREQLNLAADLPNYLKDVFVWIPYLHPLFQLGSHLFSLPRGLGIRAYYYTSVVGDDSKISAVRRGLRNLAFDPQVFKKDSTSQKSKGVDITLTKDMLSHAFLDNYQDAILVAGDGDYVPLIEEVKRRGKRLYLAFFEAAGLGLAPELPLIADGFADLAPVFCAQWQKRLGELKPATR